MTWLTSAEKKWVQNRLEDDVGKSGRDIKIPIKDIFKMIFTDYKVSIRKLFDRRVSRLITSSSLWEH